MKALSLNENKSGSPWKISCPACHCDHVFTDGWAFNLDYNFPTFLPAMYIKLVDPTGKKYICHGRVRNGMITFLGDSTHYLRGKTVPLPDLVPVV